MSAYLVQCGEAPTGRLPAAAKKVSVRLYKPSATATFEFWNITHKILHNLSPAYQDLLEIAAYVYIADTECKRWRERDVLNREWRREFQFNVPVQVPDLWNSHAVADELSGVLERVTGDRFRFRFTHRPAPAEQLFFDWTELAPFGGTPDCVSLLSGGADSLVGAMHLLEESKLTPVFVSHRSVAILDSRQKRVADLLRDRYGGSRFGHVSLWLHRTRTGAREMTQRSRGFLFLALATAVAKQLGIGAITIPENGPVSLNVRKLQQSYSTTLSQTTRPEFLLGFERLANARGVCPFPSRIRSYLKPKPKFWVGLLPIRPSQCWRRPSRVRTRRDNPQ